MPLYKSKGEYLEMILKRLIDQVEYFTNLQDLAKQGLPYDEYRVRRDLDDEIRDAKNALKEADDMYYRD